MAPPTQDDASPARRLEEAVHRAIDVARKARKHRQGLDGGGFYARKFADLKIAATNAFTDLGSATAGDTTALAEMINTTFAPNASVKARAEAERELTYALRTTWRDQAAPKPVGTADEFFPSSILKQTRRGYLSIIGRQINACFQAECHDGCAVMMRRLFEIAIIEAFEGKNLDQKIKNNSGDFLQLSDLVARALSEASFKLSRNTKRALPRLRDVGHLSAHGRAYFATRADLESVRTEYRVAVEELLRAAGLL